ncbi:MAG: T9SS type A sorting domain-containing protein [Candidatus Marinimicrobia bacterium]|nr:T9SS type A sorting domain-containing protein [Candidatus Neomarinimicrobiota bacterium]MCF7902833.1 T9SS type A sorting domain-containing protein [Candidatus Neomarinimicrobiota bacterium]
MTIVNNYTNSPAANIAKYLLNHHESIKHDESAAAPRDYSFLQNYSNPFNPTTTIQYMIRYNGLVTVVIYDHLGRKVKMLVNRDHSAGEYKLIWNGTNDSGQQLSSGLYFCRLQAEKSDHTIKIVYLN